MTRVHITNPNGSTTIGVLAWPFETLLEWYGPTWGDHTAHIGHTGGRYGRPW